MKIRILTNLNSLANLKLDGSKLEISRIPNNKNGILNLLQTYWNHRKFDYIVFNGSGPDLFILAFAKYLFINNKIKIISLDLQLSEPEKIGQKIKTIIKKVLFKQVDVFALYYKNYSEIQRIYKIPTNKFRYIPFKINNYSKVVSAKTSDMGFVFCGGKTRRDFGTLIKAVRGTKIPVRIVTMANEHIVEHGSFLDESNIPDNVEIVKLDGSFEPFLKHMAESRIVVLPLKEGICGTGIGVYIMAMALKKCVIISNGVGVEDVLNDKIAIIVPPNDYRMLRDAIKRAWNDKSYREKYEINGHQYAIELGGEERLIESVMGILLQDYITSHTSGKYSVTLEKKIALK